VFGQPVTISLFFPSSGVALLFKTGAPAPRMFLPVFILQRGLPPFFVTQVDRLCVCVDPAAIQISTSGGLWFTQLKDVARDKWRAIGFAFPVSLFEIDLSFPFPF